MEGPGSYTVGAHYNENQPNPSDLSLPCHLSVLVMPSPGHSQVDNLPSPHYLGTDVHNVTGSSWHSGPVATRRGRPAQPQTLS